MTIESWDDIKPGKCRVKQSEFRKNAVQLIQIIEAMPVDCQMRSNGMACIKNMIELYEGRQLKAKSK